MSDVLHAEFIKIRASRLLAGPLVVAVALIGLFVLANHAIGHNANGAHVLLSTINRGAPLAMVAGIIGMAGEYRHGTLAISLVVAPKRIRLLMAKVLAYAVVGLAYGVCSAVLALTAALLVLGGALPLAAGQAAAILAGGVATYVLFAVTGVGLAAIVRHQVVAVVAALVWLYLAESFLDLAVPAVAKFLPSGASEALVGMRPEGLSGNPSATEGAAVLVTYATATVVLGAWMLNRRDIQ